MISPSTLFILGVGLAILRSQWKDKPTAAKGSDGQRIPKQPYRGKLVYHATPDEVTSTLPPAPETRDEIERRWLCATSVKERKAIARELQSFDIAQESGELKKDPDLWIVTTPESHEAADISEDKLPF